LLARADRATELEAVHLRHHEIEQHQIERRLRARDRFDGELTIGRGRGLEAVTLEDAANDTTNRVAVVHDEDARAHGLVAANLLQRRSGVRVAWTCSFPAERSSRAMAQTALSRAIYSSARAGLPRSATERRGPPSGPPGSSTRVAAP